MLTIFNNLKPFIEESNREIHVREYARITKVSAPTAAKLLATYEKENILSKRIDKGHHCYRANKNPVYIDLCRIYWREKLSALTKYLSEQYFMPTIILFGSLSKGNAGKRSDIDLAVFAATDRKPNITSFEKALGRPIHIYYAKSFEAINNPHLRANIYEEGLLLDGLLDWAMGRLSREEQGGTSVSKPEAN